MGGVPRQVRRLVHACPAGYGRLQAHEVAEQVEQPTVGSFEGFGTADVGRVPFRRTDAGRLQVDPYDLAAHAQPVVSVRAAVDRPELRRRRVQLGAEAVVLLDEEVPVAITQAP